MKKRRKKNKKQEKETGAPSSENQSPNYSWGKGATLVPRIVISSTTMEKKNSNGIQKDCRLDLPGNLSRWELVGMVMERACLVVRTSVVRVTRMAYSSPRLWLMAIGWWNKINQCRKLKLNLTQTWGVWMSLDLGMHWSQIQWYCDDKPCQERNKFRARRSKRMQSLKHSFKKVFESHAQLAHFITLAKEMHVLLILNFSILTFITMLEPPCHLQDSTLKWCARNLNLLKFLNKWLSKSLYK